MSKIPVIIFLIVLCNICNAQNIVLNPGFETATVGLPLGTPFTAYPLVTNNWSAVNTDGEFMFDSTLAHTGTGFMSVLQNAAGNPKTSWLGVGGSGGYDRAIQVIPVSPSTTYQLDFWTRSGEGLRYLGYGAGRLLVQIEQVSPSFSQIDSFSILTPLAWQQWSSSFTTGSNCTSIALLFSAYDAAAVDAWVDDIDIHVSSLEGVNDASKIPEVSVYPNPVQNKLYVDVANSGVSEITLYDASSRKLLQKSFTIQTILNTEAFTKGFYFYEIKNRSALIKKGKFLKE